ncbi:MAG: hypothetical protein U5L96_11960 [Owenweeksia sp.]|nr:hypothetical protein [Owenweeksia sp.]
MNRDEQPIFEETIAIMRNPILVQVDIERGHFSCGAKFEVLPRVGERINVAPYWADESFSKINELVDLQEQFGAPIVTEIAHMVKSNEQVIQIFAMFENNE